MRKALIIEGDNGKITDLSDILRIARANGKKILNCEKVNVLPVVTPFGNGYLVVVKPERDGRRKSSVVGREKKEHI